MNTKSPCEGFLCVRYFVSQNARALAPIITLPDAEKLMSCKHHNPDTVGKKLFILSVIK